MLFESNPYDVALHVPIFAESIAIRSIDQYQQPLSFT